MNLCFTCFMIIFLINKYQNFPLEIYKNILKEDLSRSGYEDGDIEDIFKYEIDKDKIKKMYFSNKYSLDEKNNKNDSLKSPHSNIINNEIKIENILNDRYKMVLVVRKDLKMSPGKIAAQVSHAAIGLYKKSLLKNNLELFLWEKYFYSSKIVLAIDSEYDLIKICEMSQELNIVNIVIKDAGRTEIKSNTITVCGLGPDKSNKIDLLTHHLKLL